MALLPERFGAPGSGRIRRVLDAGCGNGMLAWKAWQKGNVVLGVTIKAREAEGCRRLFNGMLGISESRLRFVVHDLHESRQLACANEPFDEIICTDVIEHIVDDRSICRQFFELLRPGGALHLTAPNAEHPYNAAFPLDTAESGGHVRPGYTEKTFRELLEPIGFVVEVVDGFGGPLRQWFNVRIKQTQEKFGAWAGAPWFLLALPVLWMDAPAPAVPYSWYVQARRPGKGPEYE